MDRKVIQIAYIEDAVERMSVEELVWFAKMRMKEDLDLLDDEELIAEVRDLAPELLEESK